MTNNIRKMKVAGQFYPADSVSIQILIDENINCQKKSDNKIKALIAPHAGYVFSGKTAVKTISYALNSEYKNIFIIAPSHYVRFNGIALSSFEKYETPFGDLSVNKEIVDDLKKKGFTALNEAHIHEHSLEVQLPFIKSLFKGVQIIPLICGFTNSSIEEKIVNELENYWINDENLFLISSDFTHFGQSFNYMPFNKDIKENLKKLDGEAIENILKLSPEGFEKFLEKTSATICGRTPISIMLKLAKKTQNKLNLNTELVEYTTSGEISGDFRHCVSYAGIILYQEDKDKDQDKEVKMKDKSENSSYYSENQQQQMLTLARKTIENKILNRNFDLEKIPDYLNEVRSCFVTLHKPNGQLRGCIGNIEAFEPLYDNIKHNAENSAFADPRFMKLNSIDELESLHIEISVLTPKQKIDSYKDIVLGKHGIILRAQGRGAVFLPQVAPEQGWDISTTLSHLSMKAGLPSDAWQKDFAKFEVFEAIVFNE